VHVPALLELLNNQLRQGRLALYSCIQMKSSVPSTLLKLAVPALMIVLGAGCGGIRGSQSVSPASFFLPGIMKNEPSFQPLDRTVPCQTNAPMVALAR
jgi:hypothetical protein